MDDKEKLRLFIRESLEGDIIEEGIMDWLFSRWRKGGRFIGTKGRHGAKDAYLEDAQNNLKNLYAAMGKLKKHYPQATTRIRKNIRRLLIDVEYINMMIEKGVSEESFIDK